MMKIFKYSVCLSALFFAQAASAQNPIEGSWQIVEAVGAPGIYTEEAELEAKRAVNRTFTITGSNVALYNGLACNVKQAQNVTLTDFDFGSAGGSWREIGIIPKVDDPRAYDAIQIDIDCPTASAQQQRNRQILIANKGDITFLNFWETWARIEKRDATPQP